MRRLSLQAVYPISQYMAAVLIAISYPRLSAQTGLLLWVMALPGLSMLLDCAYLRVYRKGVCA